MKRQVISPVLPTLILPFLALSVPAQQMTGTSHPDQTTTITTDTTVTTSSPDHYVKPAHAAAYQDSYPATGAGPATSSESTPASEPRLIQRDSAVVVTPAPAYQAYAPATPPPPPGLTARAGIDPADGQIVTEVPAGPHELHRGTLLHARLRESLNTKTTPEDAVFTAELTSDVNHHGEVILPAGSLIRGHVTSIHGGKRITGGASMHLRPETISLPDGTLYHLNAQVTDLESTQDLRVNDEGTVVLRSNPKEAAAVVGGVAGVAAVTGAVVGGGVGAAVGAVAGAGVATAVYLKREVQELLPAGTDVIFALDAPFSTTAR